MHTYEYALDGFEVGGIEDAAGNLQRVDLRAGGEGVGIVAQRVVLGEVVDGIAEVDGIGGVRLQRVLQLDDDALAFRGDVGEFHLRG